MTKTIVLILGLLIGAATVFAANTATVLFSTGSAVLKPKTGASHSLALGEVIRVGDTIQTGKNGSAELDQAGVTLKINPSTVFTLLEREQGGQNRAVVSVFLGSVKMKYDKLNGKEPLIHTTIAQAGVRGTELTVYSAEDGSTLITVDSGLVDVSSGGQTVALSAGEGVDASPATGLGVKFDIQKIKTDYDTWNQDRLMSMLADPVASLASLHKQLDIYAKGISDYDAAFAEYSKKLAAGRAQYDVLYAKNKDEAKTYLEQTLDPLTVQTGNLFLNKRFNALAALSLRRYVVGRLYVLVKPLLQTSHQDWSADFLGAYDSFLTDFEKTVAPHLVDADI